MPLDDLDAILTEAEPLAGRFVAAGFSLFLVGGIVRDLWLDREVSGEIDLDLTTDATPPEVKAIVGPMADAVWLQGERFGTIGARVGGRAYEITTHRSEVYGEHSRKPDVAFAKAIDVDLSRRDFTVNAMAVELPAGHLIDPFGGAGDLGEKRLRTPLDPEISFTDDPLRMLRAARFVAGYGLRPIPAVVDAMSLLRERLDIVSAERIRDELDKLIVTGQPAIGLNLLAETGLLERFLPEITNPGLPDRAAALPHLRADATVRLATLLYGLDSGVVASRLRTLRHSTRRQQATRSILSGTRTLVAGELRDAPSIRRWVAAVGDRRQDVRAVAAAVSSSSAAAVELSLTLERELGVELDDLTPGLTGDEIMALLGVDEGPAVGEALAFVQDLRFGSGPLGVDEVTQRLLDWWNSKNSP